MVKPQRRHLRNFLLDRTFQLRYTLVIVLISGVLTSGLGYFWYAEMRTASSMVETKELAKLGMSDDEVKKIESDINRKDRLRLVVLVGFGVLTALALAGFGIVFTHRVAGPLFKIGRHMRDVREGRLPELWDLRKGDQLQEFWAEFKEMYLSLQQRTADEVQLLEAAVAALEGRCSDDGDAEAQLGRLRELLDRKRSALAKAELPAQQAHEGAG